MAEANNVQVMNDCEENEVLSTKERNKVLGTFFLWDRKAKECLIGTTLAAVEDVSHSPGDGGKLEYSSMHSTVCCLHDTVNSLMFAGINVCILATKNHVRGD